MSEKILIDALGKIVQIESDWHSQDIAREALALHAKEPKQGEGYAAQQFQSIDKDQVVYVRTENDENAILSVTYGNGDKFSLEQTTLGELLNKFQREGDAQKEAVDKELRKLLTYSDNVDWLVEQMQTFFTITRKVSNNDSIQK